MQLRLLAGFLASLSTGVFAELAERQSSCPAVNSTFYLQAKTLGAINGQYGDINPQGPFPVFTPNISDAVQYYLDSSSRLHTTAEKPPYDIWTSLNYDLSGDPDTADEVQYVAIYKPYKNNTAVLCDSVPTDAGGCALKCRKRIYVKALDGYLTLRQLYLCASRPRGVALGTSTQNTQYKCNKLGIEIIPIDD